MGLEEQASASDSHIKNRQVVGFECMPENGGVESQRPSLECVLSRVFPISPFSFLGVHFSHPGPAHLWLLAAPVDRSTPSSSLCIDLSSLGRPPVPNGRCLFHTPHPYANGPVSVVIVVTVTFLGLFLQGQGWVYRAWPRVNAGPSPAVGQSSAQGGAGALLISYLPGSLDLI